MIKSFLVLLFFLVLTGGYVWWNRQDFQVQQVPIAQNLSEAFAIEVRRLREQKQVDDAYFLAKQIEVSDLRKEKNLPLDAQIMAKPFSNNTKKQLLVRIDVFDDSLETDRKAIFQVSLFELNTKNKLAEFGFTLAEPKTQQR